MPSEEYYRAQKEQEDRRTNLIFYDSCEGFNQDGGSDLRSKRDIWEILIIILLIGGLLCLGIQAFFGIEMGGASR